MFLPHHSSVCLKHKPLPSLWPTDCLMAAGVTTNQNIKGRLSSHSIKWWALDILAFLLIHLQCMNCFNCLKSTLLNTYVSHAWGCQFYIMKVMIWKILKHEKVIRNGNSSQAGEPVKANYLCTYKIAYSVPILKDQLISPMIVQNGVEYLTSVLLQLFSQPSSGTDVRTQTTFFLSLLSHLNNSLPTRHLWMHIYIYMLTPDPWFGGE